MCIVLHFCGSTHSRLPAPRNLPTMPDQDQSPSPALPQAPAQPQALAQPQPPTSAAKPQFNLFVANINFDATVEQLTAHFSVCGPVVACNIVIDKETGWSKGFGFVELTTEQAMKSGLDMDSTEFQGRLLTIRVAESKRRRFGPPRLPRLPASNA